MNAGQHAEMLQEAIDLTDRVAGQVDEARRRLKRLLKNLRSASGGLKQVKDAVSGVPSEHSLDDTELGGLSVAAVNAATAVMKHVQSELSGGEGKVVYAHRN